MLTYNILKCILAIGGQTTMVWTYYILLGVKNIMTKNYMCKIAEDMDRAIQAKNFSNLLSQIEHLWDEQLAPKKFYLDKLQESIEVEGITADQITIWAGYHNRPHWIFTNPKSVIRRVENGIDFN